LLSASRTVSSPSTRASVRMGMVNVADVLPSPKLRVPDVVV
jgi:hypothetical protein